jgi:hypothetical protein
MRGQPVDVAMVRSLPNAALLRSDCPAAKCAVPKTDTSPPTYSPLEYGTAALAEHAINLGDRKSSICSSAKYTNSARRQLDSACMRIAYYV